MSVALAYGDDCYGSALYGVDADPAPATTTTTVNRAANYGHDCYGESLYGMVSEDVPGCTTTAVNSFNTYNDAAYGDAGYGASQVVTTCANTNQSYQSAGIDKWRMPAPLRSSAESLYTVGDIVAPSYCDGAYGYSLYGCFLNPTLPPAQISISSLSSGYESWIVDNSLRSSGYDSWFMVPYLTTSAVESFDNAGKIEPLDTDQVAVSKIGYAINQNFIYKIGI